MAITNVGDSQSYSYTGGMQAFMVPVSGIYKLEAYGARGGVCQGNAPASHGLGGYGAGYAI